MIALAALGARTPPQRRALALAVAGVYLLTDVQLGRRAARRSPSRSQTPASSPLYIVLAHRVAKRDGLGGIDGLAAAMLVARVVITPIGGWTRCRPSPTRSRCWPAIGVGVSSSVIPYVCDQLAMARMPRATYALMCRSSPRPRR